MILYHLVLLFSHLGEVYLQTTPDISCCEWKSVKNSAESFLDGWYQLKEIKDDKPDDVCGDSCVYTQVPSDGYDYCFKDEASSSEVFCEVMYATQSVSLSIWLMRLFPYSLVDLPNIKTYCTKHFFKSA